MSTLTARIGPEGQVTIPAAIREKLGLRPGHLLKFDEKDGSLTFRRMIDPVAAQAVLGCAREKMKGRTSAQWIEWMRGPVELAPKKNGDRRR